MMRLGLGLILLWLGAPNAENPAEEIMGMSSSMGATCGINTMEAAHALGEATKCMSEAMEKCTKASDTLKVSCGVPIGKVIQSFMHIASFVAGAAQQCAKALHLESLYKNLGIDGFFEGEKSQAACAEVVTGFIASLGEIATQAMTLTKTCSGVRIMPGLRFPGVTADNVIRHLDRVEGAGTHIEAECSLDVTGTIVLLASSGTKIGRAMDSCQSIPGGIEGEDTRAHCGVDVAEIIMSFSNAANSISKAVTDCGLSLSLDQECAGSIAGLIAGLAHVSATGVGFQTHCPVLNKTARVLPEIHV
jgi:hypothetical protein